MENWVKTIVEQEIVLLKKMRSEFEGNVSQLEMVAKDFFQKLSFEYVLGDWEVEELPQDKSYHSPLRFVCFRVKSDDYTLSLKVPITVGKTPFKEYEFYDFSFDENIGSALECIFETKNEEKDFSMSLKVSLQYRFNSSEKGYVISSMNYSSQEIMARVFRFVVGDEWN